MCLCMLMCVMYVCKYTIRDLSYIHKPSRCHSALSLASQSMGGSRGIQLVTGLFCQRIAQRGVDPVVVSCDHVVCFVSLVR